MKEELSTLYTKLRDKGLREVGRTTSRLVNRNYYDVVGGSRYNRSGVDILSEDWDNLIILDACRYDYFKLYNELEGTLESRISKGSTSKEFIVGNFEGRKSYDTVYLSDNPWWQTLSDEIDSELYHFTDCKRDAFGGTVSYPSTVTESAIDYNQQYPNKRLIVHYLQPHAPYFTPAGEELCRWPSENGHDDCDPMELKRAYVSNLNLVLSEIEPLLEELAGKTVITADHGELLGERLPPIPLKQYQHPGGIYREELVKVPWFVVDHDERKEIIAGEEPAQADPISEAERDTTEQLKSLGYIE